MEDGPNAAVREFLAGSAMVATEELSASFARMEATYGQVLGYDLVRRIQVASAVQQYYIVTLHADAPTYASFTCYLRSGDWVLSNFNISPEIADIFPAPLLVWLFSEKEQ